LDGRLTNSAASTNRTELKVKNANTRAMKTFKDVEYIIKMHQLKGREIREKEMNFQVAVTRGFYEKYKAGSVRLSVNCM
jgi:hypothetical protein